MTQAEQIYNKHECARYDKSTGEFGPNYEAILAAIQEALDIRNNETKEFIRQFGECAKSNEELRTQLAAKEKKLKELDDENRELHFCITDLYEVDLAVQRIKKCLDNIEKIRNGKRIK